MKLRTIPNNYNSISNQYRNIGEAVIFDGLYLLIIYLLHLPFKASIYIALGLIPITIFFIIGIDDQSVINFLLNYIKFRQNRRIMEEPTSEYIREKSKAILLKNQKKNTTKKGKVKNGKQ